jgi:hypothetical protein
MPMLTQSAGAPYGSYTAPDSGDNNPALNQQPAADIYVMGALTRMRVSQS